MNQQLRIINQNSVITLDNYQLDKIFDPITNIDVDVVLATAYLYDGEDLLFTLTESDVISVIDNYAIIAWDSAQTTSLTTAPKANYRLQWNINNGQYIFNRYFDVVYWKLINPITEFDILNEKPELIRYRPQYDGTVTDQVDFTAFICDQFSEPTDFWKGSQIEFTSRNNQGVKAIITEWSYDTRQFQVDNTYNIKPAKNDRFEIRRAYNPEINSAWTTIQSRIQAWDTAFRNKDDGTTILVDTADIKLLHLYQSMLNIAHSLRLKDKDTFDLWIEEYSAKVDDALNNVRAKIDYDNDGILGSVDDIRQMTTWFTL